MNDLYVCHSLVGNTEPGAVWPQPVSSGECSHFGEGGRVWSVAPDRTAGQGTDDVCAGATATCGAMQPEGWGTGTKCLPAPGIQMWVCLLVCLFVCYFVCLFATTASCCCAARWVKDRSPASFCSWDSDVSLSLCLCVCYLFVCFKSEPRKFMELCSQRAEGQELNFSLLLGFRC